MSKEEKPSLISAASVDSDIIIEAAHVKGTTAVMKSPQRDRLTPRVSLIGELCTGLVLTTCEKDRKKKLIIVINMNHNQYWYSIMWIKNISFCILEGDATKGSG
jgi:hypothetical protein